MNNILIAFILMLSISLVACVALTLVSRFFGIEEDPKKKEVRECLPGINCGACGFKGCDDYAEALAQQQAKPNLCVPGAKKVIKKISKILGVAAEEFNDVVAFVSCNGTCDATNKKSEYDGVSSCKAVSALYGGTGECVYGCLGLGDCAKVCPAGAICTIDGIARIDSKKCLGCGLCVGTCPKHIISMVPQHTTTVVVCSNKQKGADARKACKNACIGCKKCEKVCNFGAITVNNNLASVDQKKCTHCGECAKQCPTGCLKFLTLPNMEEVE